MFALTRLHWQAAYTELFNNWVEWDLRPYDFSVMGISILC
jgi:hypothetical protein